MNLQGRMEKRKNKEDKEYEALIITFPNGYEKMVFLNTSEKFLIKTITEKK